MIPIKADRLGRTSYTLALEGPGGVDLARAFELEVGAPSGEVKRTTVQALSAKTGKLTVSSDVLTGLIAERSSVTVTVGPAAGFDVPGLLAALDRYPYGCAEQTTSRALPSSSSTRASATSAAAISTSRPSWSTSRAR